MREFFKGWRRKVGTATLVMACVFTAGWVWSLAGADEDLRVNEIRIAFNPRIYCVALESKGVIFVVERVVYKFESAELEVNSVNWTVHDSDEAWYWTRREYGPPLQEDPVETEWDLIGLRYETYWETRNRIGYHCLTVPYWSIVFPLTLLSAILLLWKPRPMKVTGTAQAQGE